MKKVFIVFLAATVFFSTTLILTTRSAHALGIDTAVKIAAGSSAKQVVRAIAEKAGLKLSGKQLDNVVGHINKRAVDGDGKAIKFIEDVSSKTPSPSPKSGFRKYVLEPAAWISGLDLVFEAYDAFMIAFGSDNPEEKNITIVDEKCGFPVPVPPGRHYAMNGYKNMFAIMWDDSDKPQDGFISVRISNNADAYIDKFDHVEMYYFSQYGWSGSRYGANVPPDTMWSGTHYGATNAYPGQTGWSTSDLPVYESYGDGIKFGIFHGAAPIGFQECSFIVEDTDVISVPSISNSVKSNFDNDTYYNNRNLVNYNMAVDVPEDISDSVTTNTDVMWNMEDGQITGGNFYVIDSGGGDVIINPPDDDNNPPDNGGVLVPVEDPVPVPKNFFTVMSEMGKKVIDTYNGIVKFAEDSVTGMQSLIVGTSGLVSFLGGFFSWLPPQFVTIMSVGFMMGFIAFFFRR